MREVIAQGVEVVDQFLFVVRLAQRIQKIILEIQEIGQDRLFPKLLVGKTATIIQSLIGLYLQAGQ